MHPGVTLPQCIQSVLGCRTAREVRACVRTNTDPGDAGIRGGSNVLSSASLFELCLGSLKCVKDETCLQKYGGCG